MSSTTHIYRVSPGRRYTAAGLFGGLFIVMGVAAALEQTAGAGGIAAGFTTVGLLLGGIMYWFVDRARLIVTSEGLTLRQIGYTVTTEWTNVERLDMTKGREGAVLRQPTGQRRAEAGASGLGRLTLPKVPLGDGRFIPFAPFMWQWEGPLGRDFYRYLPHLFQQ